MGYYWVKELYIVTDEILLGEGAVYCDKGDITG
jgi:hypothetical protein